MAKSYVQKELEKARRRFKAASSKLEKAAKTASKAGETVYAEQLKKRASTLREITEASKIGRRGTAAERKAKAKAALKSLTKESKLLSKASKASSASALREARVVRMRQEKMFEAKLKSGVITREESALFFSETKKFWQGSATPRERLQRITLGTKTSNIMEAYESVMQSSGIKDMLDQYNAAMNGDYDLLKKAGWTDDEIQELKDYDDLGSKGDSPKRAYVLSKLT